MTPKVIASPMAISTRTEPRLRPKTSVSKARVEAAPAVNGFHRRRGGLPHVLVAFDKTAVGRFVEQKRQPVTHILTDALLRVAIAWRRACGVGTVKRSQCQSSGDLFLDAGIRFHRDPLAQQRYVGLSSDLDISRTASNRTATSGLDNEKCATVARKALLKPLFVPIWVRLSAEADPASFSVRGSINLKGSRRRS